MASERACERCGRRFVPKSARARFCSSACRSEAHRSKGSVVPLERPASPAGLVAVLTSELESVERVDTPLGQAALAVAARIDAGNESGAAIAALSRELRALRAEVLADVDVPDSRVARLRDELAERRHG